MDIHSEIPDILYKYRNWDDSYHRRVLTDNELFLSSADLFNDPFDASLPIQYPKEKLTKENIIKKLIEVDRPKYRGIDDDKRLKIANERFLECDYSSDEYWRDVNSRFKKRDPIYGICSLTSKKDNLLMWAHYADSHRGICIGFDSSQLSASAHRIIEKVNYSDCFPKIKMFDEGYESWGSLITTKSKLWEYEDEYRITKIYGARKLFKINDLAFKEIVFGCKISQKHREEIISIAKSKDSIIKLYDCVTDDREFKLNLVEIK